MSTHNGGSSNLFRVFPSVSKNLDHCLLLLILDIFSLVAVTEDLPLQESYFYYVSKLFCKADSILYRDCEEKVKLCSAHCSN